MVWLRNVAIGLGCGILLALGGMFVGMDVVAALVVFASGLYAALPGRER